MLAAGSAGGGMMSDGLKGMAQGVADLKEAVGNGATLDPAAAQALVTSLQDGIEKVDATMREQHREARGHMPIGTTPAANTYRPVFQSVESDPDQGFETAMEKLKQQLQDAIHTVQACVKSTEENDANVAAHMRGIQA